MHCKHRHIDENSVWCIEPNRITHTPFSQIHKFPKAHIHICMKFDKYQQACSTQCRLTHKRQCKSKKSKLMSRAILHNIHIHAKHPQSSVLSVSECMAVFDCVAYTHSCLSVQIRCTQIHSNIRVLVYLYSPYTSRFDGMCEPHDTRLETNSGSTSVDLQQSIL